MCRKQRLREMFVTEFEDSLSEQHKTVLMSLLEEYHDVFSLEESERGETDAVELHIDTGDARPKSQPSCRVPSLFDKRWQLKVSRPLKAATRSSMKKG